MCIIIPLAHLKTGPIVKRGEDKFLSIMLHKTGELFEFSGLNVVPMGVSGPP